MKKPSILAMVALCCALNLTIASAQPISGAPSPPFTTTQNGSVKAPGAVNGFFLGDDGNFHSASGTGTLTEQKNTAGTGLSTSGNCDNTSTNASSPCQYGLSTITGPGVLGATGNGAGQSVGTVQTPVLLATLTASASSSLSDTTHFTNAYSYYELVFEDILPGTTATTCQIQIHSGGTFQSAGYAYSVGGTNPAGTLIAQGSNSTSFIPCSDSASVTNTEPGISGIFRLFNPSASGQIHPIVGQYIRPPTQQSVAGYWGTAGVIDGFQVSFSSGTFSGVIKIYGVP